MISFEPHACSSHGRPTVTRRLISEGRIHIAHLMLLSTLSECKVRRNLSDLILLMRVVAEFWSLIEPAIPGIVALVKDSVGKAVRPGTVVFSKFSSQFMGHWHGLALLMEVTAVDRRWSSIYNCPEIVNLLNIGRMEKFLEQMLSETLSC